MKVPMKASYKLLSDGRVPKKHFVSPWRTNGKKSLGETLKLLIGVKADTLNLGWRIRTLIKRANLILLRR
jgi:hypothetical protein